jgi:hypothetical protein
MRVSQFFDDIAIVLGIIFVACLLLVMVFPGSAPDREPPIPDFHDYDHERDTSD